MNSSDLPPVAVVIEDDADVRHLICTVLGQSGFSTVQATNGEDGVLAVQQYLPVITTIDVTMPGMDGFAVARKVREFTDGYIVMVSGQDDEIDVVQGLGAGADDYVIKPFRPRELRARIETMMRRPRDGASHLPAGPPPPVAPAAPGHAVLEAPAPPAPAPPPTPVSGAGTAVAERVESVEDVAPSSDLLEMRGLVLDTATRLASLEECDLDLTRSEFDLLASLMHTGRRVRSKADLVLMLRGESYVTSYYVNDADKRAVEVHVANLRRKLGESANAPRWIETVRGVGYRMTAGDA
jgi:DNA-binding response OmpR family regulator